MNGDRDMTEEEMKAKHKREMAEWLAEKVLGINPNERFSMYSFRNHTPIIFQWGEVVDFIYSPDGFFAVWDAVMIKLKEYSIDIEFSYSTIQKVHICGIGYNSLKMDEGNSFEATGKDRYEAFYNAVFEAFKE